MRESGKFDFMGSTDQLVHDVDPVRQSWAAHNVCYFASEAGCTVSEIAELLDMIGVNPVEARLIGPRRVPPGDPDDRSDYASPIVDGRTTA